MRLKEVIAILEKYPQDKVCKYGFGEADSYRGFYERIAFEPKSFVTVGQMLTEAKKAVGVTFNGYKGGEYVMDGETLVHIAPYGCTDYKENYEEGLTEEELVKMIDNSVENGI